jgi:hypothetical protein
MDLSSGMQMGEGGQFERTKNKRTTFLSSCVWLYEYNMKFLQSQKERHSISI